MPSSLSPGDAASAKGESNPGVNPLEPPEQLLTAYALPSSAFPFGVQHDPAFAQRWAARLPNAEWLQPLLTREAAWFSEAAQTGRDSEEALTLDDLLEQHRQQQQSLLLGYYAATAEESAAELAAPRVGIDDADEPISNHIASATFYDSMVASDSNTLAAFVLDGFTKFCGGAFFLSKVAPSRNATSGTLEDQGPTPKKEKRYTRPEDATFVQLSSDERSSDEEQQAHASGFEPHTARSKTRLLNGEAVDDDVISLHGSLVERTATKSNNVVCASTYFAQKLMEGEHRAAWSVLRREQRANIRRWVKQGVRWTILAPWHNGSFHWVVCEFRFYRRTSTPSTITVSDEMPQQENGVDCGPFAIEAVRRRAFGMSIDRSKWSQRDMSLVRHLIYRELGWLQGHQPALLVKTDSDWTRAQHPEPAS